MNENKEINNNPTPVVNNNPTIFMSQRELENKLKLEKAKTKINFIFGDDEDEEDDIFSKKITTNKAEKIEEKSQNLEGERVPIIPITHISFENITNVLCLNMPFEEAINFDAEDVQEEDGE